MKTIIITACLMGGILSGCKDSNGAKIDFYTKKSDSMATVFKGILYTPKNFSKIQTKLNEWEGYTDSAQKYFDLKYNR